MNEFPYLILQVYNYLNGNLLNADKYRDNIDILIVSLLIHYYFNCE